MIVVYAKAGIAFDPYDFSFYHRNDSVIQNFTTLGTTSFNNVASR
ncbi:MAG: hypothetical protein PVSMB11_05440 [Desulfuromonadaceae bacterium]